MTSPRSVEDVTKHDWVVEYDENSVAWLVSIQDSSVRRPLEHGQGLPFLSYAAEQVAQARGEILKIVERQRQKVLANPDDLSWTEHFAEIEIAIRART